MVRVEDDRRGVKRADEGAAACFVAASHTPPALAHGQAFKAAGAAKVFGLERARHNRTMASLPQPASREEWPHSLKPQDPVDEFGAQSNVSEILSGKRELNKDHIKRLSERHHASPEMFF